MPVLCVLAWRQTGGGGGEESLLLVDGLHELAYYQRYTLDALDLLLRADQLALQTPLLVLDVLFLEVDVSGHVSRLSPPAPRGRHSLELALQLLEVGVVIVAFGGEAFERVEVGYR